MKRKEVELDGEVFEFREPTIQQMLPVLNKMSDQELRMEAQLDLLAITVYQSGQPLGDQIKSKGWSLFTSLVPHSLEVCGMTGDDDDTA